MTYKNEYTMIPLSSMAYVRRPNSNT